MSLQESLLHDPTLWLVGSFAAFMLLAFVFGRKSVAGMLDSKIDKIRANIASAENLKAEAEALIAQYKANLANAHTEAATILANAQKQAADMQTKAEKDLQESAARRECSPVVSNKWNAPRLTIFAVMPPSLPYRPRPKSLHKR